MELVFIYGTLKQGQCRGHSMQDARYIGIALALPTFAMYNVGQYPALVRDDLVDRRVCGELYECSPALMETLDRIEGVGSGLYERGIVELDEITLVQLPTTDHTHRQFDAKRAISYFFVDQARLVEAGDLIETGFWVDELKKG